MSGSVDPKDKVVIVTGVASGFGMDLAKELDKRGFIVIGTCRDVADERSAQLRASCSNQLKLIKLDVTEDEDVQNAAKEVELFLNGRTLWAVVNNAGIAAMHGIEWGSPGVELFRSVLDVNTLGVIRVCRAFLPFLRQTPGSRCVIVTSIESRSEPLTQPAYAMSKTAVRAFSNSLRRELKGKVHVSMVEPAFYATGATEERRLLADLENNWNSTPAHLRDQLATQFEQFKEFTQASLLVQHGDISSVTRTLVSIVCQKSEPRYVYRACSFVESMVLWPIDWLPEEILDLGLGRQAMIINFKLLKYIVNGPLYL
ncbi:17-beta-hydroxysteroid dehydrogenase type 6 [Halotydeus destructor]|nr:17-beta-hydroxysteroid dehydrogenase type 6 [Halotydeus destructor]